MEKHMDNQLMEKDKYFPLFSGLQMHAKIGKTQKRGFIGPSIFPLCMQAKETMEHMLSECNFSLHMWDKEAQVMCTMDHHRDKIPNTISS
jgi:hypothetical protein